MTVLSSVVHVRLSPVRARERLASHLSANVVRLRDEQGLTQQALAGLARLSRATIAQIETGQADPRLSTIELVASALGVSPQSLLSDPRMTGRC